MRKKKTFIFIGILLLIATIIFETIFDLYYVATGSMIPTLVPGDLVLVNKMSYGYRRIDKDQEVTHYFQNSKVSRGDVILFNLPVGDRIYKDNPQVSFFSRVKNKSIARALADTLELGKLESLVIGSQAPYFKRVVAVSGDTLQLREGHVIINGERALEVKAVIHDTVALGKGEVGEWDHKWVFPHDKTLNWGYYNFGPLVVPGKGDSLHLSLHSLPIYERLIRVYEGNELTIDNGKIYINGKQTLTYSVEQDYYFVMGDNRKDSYDSRIWGLVPFDHVIGKASIVLVSQSKDGSLRKERILKSVD